MSKRTSEPALRNDLLDRQPATIAPFALPDPRRVTCSRCVTARLLPAEREYVPGSSNQYRCIDRAACKTRSTR